MLLGTNVQEPAGTGVDVLLSCMPWSLPSATNKCCW